MYRKASLNKFSSGISVNTRIRFNKKGEFKRCYLLGLAYFKRNEFDKALIYFQKALNLEPDNISVLCGLGISLLGSSLAGDTAGPERAIICFQKALELGPSNSSAIIANLALCYERLEKYQEGFEMLRKFVLKKGSYNFVNVKSSY